MHLPWQNTRPCTVLLHFYASVNVVLVIVGPLTIDAPSKRLHAKSTLTYSIPVLNSYLVTVLPLTTDPPSSRLQDQTFFHTVYMYSIVT